MTEPLEFSFTMFVAPVLYVIHAVLTGISRVHRRLHGLDCRFPASAPVWWIWCCRPGNPLANWWMLMVMGLVFFAIYYMVFLFTISPNSVC